MTYEYDLISEKKLPAGFKYPKSFLHYLKYNETEEETATHGCWEERSLIRASDDGEEYLSFFYRRLQHDFPNKNFVPFSRLYDDLIYCFDGNDTSGDPGIYIVKTFTNQWGIDNQSFEEVDYENFYEWLRMSLVEGVEECASDVALPCVDISSTFKYPQEYLDVVKIADSYRINRLYNSRFFFINCTLDEDRENFSNLLKKYNSLIPFMGRFDNGGATHIGCFFDGEDMTGNPMVYIYDLTRSSILATYPNFNTFWDKLSGIEEALLEQFDQKKNHEK